MLRDGRTPSVYGFALGAVQKFELDANNRVTLEQQHGCYHIKSFEAGKHFWISHRFIKDARATYRETVARLRRR